MPSIHPTKFVVALAVFSLCLSPSIFSQENKEPSSSQEASQTTYPDNTEGLRELLQNTLLAARIGDQAKVTIFIKAMEIPHYEKWFPMTFGGGSGESWADPYGKMLDRHEHELQEFLTQLSQKDGEVFVQKLDERKVYGTTLIGPLDLFFADWKKSGSPEDLKGDPIGYFFFVDGKFRWDSTAEFVRVQPKGLDFTLFKLIKKVAPVYPPEAQAQGVQGTVKLHVSIETDGSVKVLEVISGDPLLSPAALKAVRQWRYEPGRMKGKPVSVDTTIEVNFTLNQAAPTSTDLMGRPSSFTNQQLDMIDDKVVASSPAWN